jgi:hemerythrin
LESFHWDRHFETGLEIVDEQHHALVDLINRFGELLTQADSAAAGEISTLLDQLASYAQYHFQDEEGLMLRARLDPRHIGEHQRIHTRFLHEVTQMQRGVAERHEAAQELLKFLTYWLAVHILGTDQSMAKQVAAIQAGQKPEDAFVAEQVMKEGATEPLLHALNGLFQQVSERNRELQELNATLEAKVAQRTQSLAEANHLLEQMAQTDVLTGLPNRRHAMAALAQAWLTSVQDASPVACLMIDADGFKQANDKYGHDAGDEVLRQLSRQLRYAVRTDDIVCRLGGDEFLIICPNTTLDGAMKVAEATRQEISKLHVAVKGGEWLGSISVGVAVKTPAMQNFEELIKAADEGLYTAKRNGRNRVACNSISA